MRFSVTMLGLALLFCLNPAHATKVNGKITITKEFRDSLAQSDSESGQSANNYYWNQPNGIIAVAPPRVNPSKDIGLIALREGAEPKGPDNVSSVDVRTGSLAKTVIVTRPGSTIRFYNVSPFNHELYSPQLAVFKPELQSTKSFRAIEFKEEGVYEIRCKLMPHLLAYVVVTGGSDIEVSSDGSFAEELDPGKYTLKVFHGGKWVAKESIDTEGSRAMTVQLKLEPGKELAEDEKGTGGAPASAAAKPAEKEAGKESKTDN